MQEFNEPGFKTERQAGDAFHRAGHVVATRHRAGPIILLPGHLDTVYPLDSPFQEYQLPGENYASGPGVTDMKGGNRKPPGMLNEVSVDLGIGPVQVVDPRNAGTADISFSAEHVDMAIDGVGFTGSGGHTADETADLRTLPMQAKRAGVLLLRLADQLD